MNGKVCQVCQQKTAKIHITQIHNSQVHEFHICPDCAREHNVSGPDIKPILIPQEPQPGITDAEREENGLQQRALDVKTCGSCGQTYRGFRESGRLGCAVCYDTFAQEIEPLLRKIQSGLKHIGKVPGGGHPVVMDVAPLIQRKREELRLAVSSEDFEAAARLRDEIRQLEGQILS